MENQGTNHVGPHGTRRGGNAQPSVRRPPLDADELSGVLAAVRDSDFWWAVKCCIIFMALTCARSIEARNATWEEVDLANAEWTIPAARTKRGVPHRIPLSTHAVSVLDYARKRGGGEGLIFPSQRRGAVMGDTTLPSVFHRLKIPAVPHAIRASFMIWAVESTDITVPAAQAVLAHVPMNDSLPGLVPNDFFYERKGIMQEWTDFLAETMGPVVPD